MSEDEKVIPWYQRYLDMDPHMAEFELELNWLDRILLKEIANRQKRGLSTKESSNEIRTTQTR